MGAGGKEFGVLRSTNSTPLATVSSRESAKLRFGVPGRCRNLWGIRWLFSPNSQIGGDLTSFLEDIQTGVRDVVVTYVPVVVLTFLTKHPGN